MGHFRSPSTGGFIPKLLVSFRIDFTTSGKSSETYLFERISFHIVETIFTKRKRSFLTAKPFHIWSVGSEPVFQRARWVKGNGLSTLPLGFSIRGTKLRPST